MLDEMSAFLKQRSALILYLKQKGVVTACLVFQIHPGLSSSGYPSTDSEADATCHNGLVRLVLVNWTSVTRFPIAAVNETLPSSSSSGYRRSRSRSTAQTIRATRSSL